MFLDKKNELFKSRIINRFFYKDYAPNSGSNYHEELENRDLDNYKTFLDHNFHNLYLRPNEDKLVLGYEGLIDDDILSERVESRFNQIKKEIDLFLEKGNYSEYAECNDVLLGYAIIDYFTDNARLKEFHKITHTNSAKIYSYTAYWLLREKPIQIIKNEEFNRDENFAANKANSILYLNEKFVASYILSNILSDLNVNLNYIDSSENLKDSIGDFANLLVYNFKYRSFNPQSLELMITAFKTSFNISNK